MNKPAVANLSAQAGAVAGQKEGSMFLEKILKAHETDLSLMEWFYIFLKLVEEFDPKKGEVVQVTELL